ncbi:MAG: hypothetical protein FWF22_06905, partial [Treponema sp.]|nr:hypothetical protein [Treponema sp.]
NHASEFSGGNLQKLILARETEQFRDYFIFSEPAWGLDIVSSAFIWKRIAALRDKGAAIVIISTNIEEILALADRIMVMYRGRAAAEFDACEFRDGGEKELISVREKIGNCMQGLLPVPLRAGGTVQK